MPVYPSASETGQGWQGRPWPVRRHDTPVQPGAHPVLRPDEQASIYYQ